MPRYLDEDDRDEDDENRWQAEEEDEDDELPDGVYDPDEQEPTVTCPYCHQEVLEDSPRCPHCENYLSQEDAPSLLKGRGEKDHRPLSPNDKTAPHPRSAVSRSQNIQGRVA